MLDDLKMIHERDAQDALGLAEKQWQQLEYKFDLQNLGFSKNDINNIVFAGMGGSALGALLSTTWPGYDLPFSICRDYNVPSYVGSKTLFFASSYSGNTEETLTALSQAEAKKAKIVVIASGGKLVEIAKSKGYPLALLPKISQPRYATLYSFNALTSWLVKAGLLEANTKDKQFTDVIDFMKKSIEDWWLMSPTKNNQAKKLAQELVGKSIVVYGGPLMYPAAYKWKISFNENAKNIAWCNQLPEFNHNEFLGWTSHPLEKPYAVIDIRSSFEHSRTQKRFEVTERLLSGRRPASHVIEAQGKNILEQLMWSVVLGDFVSLYLALLNGLNPTPVDLIEKFKKELS